MNGKTTFRADDRPAPLDTKSFHCHVTVLAAAVPPISGTLDLAGVDSVDRYAINAIVTLRRQVRDHSTAFSLASLSHPMRRALAGAGMGETFEHESVWSRYPQAKQRVG